MLGFFEKLNVTELVLISRQVSRKMDKNEIFTLIYYWYIIPKYIYSVQSPICCKNENFFETKIYVAHGKAYDFWKINKTLVQPNYLYFLFIFHWWKHISTWNSKKTENDEKSSVVFSKNSRLQRYFNRNLLKLL